jgi:hypothetical protein
LGVEVNFEQSHYTSFVLANLLAAPLTELETFEAAVEAASVMPAGSTAACVENEKTRASVMEARERN